MKKCKKCNNEFEPRGNKGSEQIYCSQDCRQKAGIDRYKQKLINSNNNNNDNFTNRNGIEQTEIRTTINQSTNRIPDIIGSSETMLERNNRTEFYGHNGGIASEYRYSNMEEFIGLIRENANLRAEVKLLTEKVTNLESELLEYELEEDIEEETPGFLGNIMNAYKQDPTTTVLFAKDIVLEFLKPKQQTTPKTPQ
jgi:hypothetical protein